MYVAIIMSVLECMYCTIVFFVMTALFLQTCAYIDDTGATNIAVDAVSMEKNLAYDCPDGKYTQNDAYGTNIAMGAVSMEENLAYGCPGEEI